MLSDLSRAHYVPPTATTWRSPWQMYARLRDESPVDHVEPAGAPGRDYYVLSRYDDVLAAATDHETFSSAAGLTTRYDELAAIGLTDVPPLVMQDPPAHTSFRRLVSRGFTPRQVTTLEPAVRAFVRERLTRLRDAGGGHIVAELFKPLPSMVVAHYLGVPEEDRRRFDGWTDAIVAAGSADPAAAVAGAADAAAELAGYFSGLVERRRREPGDDTVSHLVRAGMADEQDDAGLVAILGFAFTMVAGGNDTSTGLLGGAVQLLTERRDQRALLLEDLARLDDAVEELLRLTSPVQGLARTTTRDVEVRGVDIPQGRKLLLLYAAANRDPDQFGADAEELDVLRRPRTILTFSHGAHHCLGAAAARLQAKVALEELLMRFPDFDVDVDGIRWADGPYVRRPTSVPFSVTS
jgi:cytochrome P450 family 130